MTETPMTPPDPIVVVSGLPRSGTSMLMKMLEAGGLPMLVDNIRTPDDDNPRGYYELERVKELDKVPDDQKQWLAEAQGRGVKVISFLLRHLPPGFEYRILFLRRDLREVVASQNRMLKRRGEEPKAPDEEVIRLFTMHLKQVRKLIDSRPELQMLEIDHREFIERPAHAAARVAEFIPLRLDREAMAGVVDPELYRNRA